MTYQSDSYPKLFKFWCVKYNLGVLTAFGVDVSDMSCEKFDGEEFDEIN